MKRGGCVYIMSSANRATLYTGVTSELYRRVWEHRNKYYPASFTARYNCVMLVYYSTWDTITDAIAEEKRIKSGSRKQKDLLIQQMNPHIADLWDTIQDWI